MAGTIDNLRHGVRGFFAWWLSELAGMIPPKVVRFLQGRRQVLIAETANNVLTLSSSGPEGRSEIVRLDLKTTTHPERAETISRALAARDSPVGSVIVRVPGSHCLRKMLDLPMAAAENLRQVLAFDMDRQTPFTRDQVYFDYAVQTVDRASRRVSVDLVVAPRSVVDQAVATARECGIVPDVVDVAWPNDQGPRVDLMPQRSRIPQSRWPVRMVTALGAVTMALLVAVVYVPLHNLKVRAAALTEEVAVARRGAEAVRKLEEEIVSIEKQRRFVIDKKIAKPLLVQTIDELTRVVPDDTWLFRVRAYGNDVQIFGYSASATSLIGLLEQSQHFQDVQFRAPLTRDARSDAERFHIGFQFTSPAQS